MSVTICAVYVYMKIKHEGIHYYIMNKSRKGPVGGIRLVFFLLLNIYILYCFLIILNKKLKISR